MIVEIGREPRFAILVAGQQATILHEIFLQEADCSRGRVNQFRSVETAARDCEPTYSERVPGGQLFLVAPRRHAFRSLGQQNALCLVDRDCFIIANLLANAQVLAPFEIRVFVKSETPGENLVVTAKQITRGFRVPQVVEALVSLRVGISR